MNSNHYSSLVQGVFKQDRLSIGRLISKVENHEPGIFPILAKLFSKTGRALRVGITGFPGSGKSTIINQLAKELTKKKKKVAVVLMDPSSPFSGGALLGDRIRMREIQMNPGVFIRSMATRGKMGGLNLAARYASDILDAAGYDFILLETVGVGQLEIDIATSSDLTIAVMTPDSGDEVQAMKAGLMEIADIFVVNKMDRDKGQIYFSRIKKGLQWHSEARGHKSIEVLPMAALYGKGIDPLTQKLIEFSVKKRQGKLNGEREKIRAEEDIKSCVEEIFMEQIYNEPQVEKKIREILPKVRSRKSSPYDAAEEVLKMGLKNLIKKNK